MTTHSTIETPHTFSLGKSLRLAHVTEPKKRWYVQWRSARGEGWQIANVFATTAATLRFIEGIAKVNPTKLEATRKLLAEQA